MLVVSHFYGHHPKRPFIEKGALGEEWGIRCSFDVDNRFAGETLVGEVNSPGVGGGVIIIVSV